MHIQAFRTVYSDKRYLYATLGISSALFIGLATISQFIFFSPVFTLYVPADSALNFSLIVIISALSGIVASVSIYRMRMARGSRKTGVGLFGSMIGAGAGACSCSTLGFSAVSAFGTIGGTATAFLSNYETPLRLVSIAILVLTYFTSVKGISADCKIVK